ncbi:hypothetical protein CEP54_009337 [Fusarium duplospermum]|uniref:Heterokaryon incompatibility domain-containing protein n=1 Tax=Fusarium duplospermum TaxID=1325734 RepID=A0A428PR98_9HYPO|nr:hypothetical protein CEP54_009337 [Fusarium duplospermum]
MTANLYEPLDELKREIRLAKLFPKAPQPSNSTDGTTSDQEQGTATEICISLRKASLNDHLEFTALSYTWGDANDTLPITVNGCPFQAARNLVVALRQLQEDDKTVTLWIDAICIQQSNNEEKTWQIQLMKEIYEKATTTVVWLGEDPESAEVMRAFSHMSQMGMSWDQGIVALKKLLNLDYWFRVWFLDTAGLTDGATRMLQQRERYRSSSPGTRGRPLLELLIYAFSHPTVDDTLRSSDPRDRVFGLLNLASDAEDLGVRPNYDKSCEDVFLETWAAILAKGQAALLVYPQYGRPQASSSTNSDSLSSLLAENGRPRLGQKLPLA